MGKDKKESTNVMETICKKCFGRPHLRAIGWIVLVFLISGFLSFVTYTHYPAISAILASICAGCVTGIAFYAISNLRNNEIKATNEEFKSIKENIALARKAAHLCMQMIESIENDEDFRSELDNLKEYTKNLAVYMGTMFIDSPKTTKLIKDLPAAYAEKEESLSAAFQYLESEKEDFDKKQAVSYLLRILQFCVATKEILLEPEIELMNDVCSLEKSVF